MKRNIEKKATAALDTIVAEDRRLEAKVEGAAGALAAHRWHWTKDEKNPERMSVTGYADLIERDRTAIQESIRRHKTLLGAGVSRTQKGMKAANTKEVKADVIQFDFEEAKAISDLAHRVIHAGYRILAQELHPDKPGGSAEAFARLHVVRIRLEGAC